MKKEEKDLLITKFLNLVQIEKTGDPDMDTIIDYLPFFGKEIFNDLINPIFTVDLSFKVLDEFELIVSEDEKYKVTFLKVIHSIESDWCIKKIKILNAPKRTLFLGYKGLDYLKDIYPEKIKNKTIISFDTRDSIHCHYIPGIMSKGTVIAVFS